ncbi:MAG: flagellar biosynthesis protein [Aquabacterium sp.]|nr:MAG: flagellar biosynthesis protein [Aquabacterium sp.]TAL20698.1 MAG: flagellar biosynthesis protein [Aquabacterium sp.]
MSPFASAQPSEAFHPGSQPVDQAAGLRQMFSTRMLRFVPVVSNPHLLFGGVVLERLCTAFGTQGLHTLVVDASERAGTPRELAEFDLREGIERLSSECSYLAARGLPLRHVDARGSSSSFLDSLAEAAPHVDVVLVYGSASDLSRTFCDAPRRDGALRLRPLISVDDQPAAITHAYAAIKILAQRGGFLAHDLIVCGRTGKTPPAAVAQRLAECADSFLGAAQRSWIEIDPTQPATAVPGPTLAQLARDTLASALVQPAAMLPPHPQAALPARLAPVLN